MLEVATLRDLLRYDPRKGDLYWKGRQRSYFNTDKYCASWNKKYAGSLALHYVNPSGYRMGRILGKSHLAHRVAYALHFGFWPKGQIDHINGVRIDNRICNLRDVSHAENSRNRRLRADNVSGVHGVYWHKRSRKWIARIDIGGKRTHLGFFEDFEAARAARKSAEAELGFHKNHGRQL